MSKTIFHLTLITAFVLITTFLIWVPHYFALSDLFALNFSNGFNTIYRNFDGLNYIVISKSFYNPQIINQIPNTLSANYYAAHFPGFPIVILLFAPFLGFLKSMLFVSLLFTILAAWVFYFLVKDFYLTKNPLLLTIIFLLLPARWIIVRSVGTPEPMFIFFILVSIYYLLKAIRFNQEENTHHLPISNFVWFSAIAASLAQLTRPPGNLYGIAVFLFVLWQFFRIYSQGKFKMAIKYFLSFYPFILIPLTLLGIFYWFHIAYNDFWAYFHSGDNIHLTLPPFSVFNQNQYWVGTIWLEDVIYTFILGFLGSLLLFKQKLYPLAFFVITYLAASTFVAHRDISRYTLPIAPFVIIAFEKILTSKEFKIILIILSLALYLYSQNFIISNVAPIPNLEVYN